MSDEQLCRIMIDKLREHYDGRWTRLFKVLFFAAVCVMLGFLLCLATNFDKSCTDSNQVAGTCCAMSFFCFFLLIIPSSSHHQTISKIELFLLTKQHLNQRDQAQHMQTLTSEFHRKMRDCLM